MSGGVVGLLIVSTVMLVAVGGVTRSARRWHTLSAGDSPRSAQCGALLVIGLALAGPMLLFAVPLVPLTASTGAICEYWPASDAFGPDAKLQAEQAQDDDYESVVSCTRRAKTLSGGSLLFAGAALGAGVYEARRRRGSRAPAPPVSRG